MTMKIVVGVDFAKTGDHALRTAMGLARGLPGSELHVVSVLPTPTEVHDARELDALSEELGRTGKRLQQHVRQVCAPGRDEEGFEHEATIHVRLGDPAGSIHQVAIDEDADFIVIGTHGRKGLERLVLGSVAEELVRTAHCPVIVGRPKEFEGIQRSDKADPARPGEDPARAGMRQQVTLDFAPRTSHISGLI